MREDLDDGDSCHSVTMHDCVEDGCWTSPPWQQAGVNIQNPAATKERMHRSRDTINIPFHFISYVWIGLYVFADVYTVKLF